jgi:hypothetical protein
MQQEAGLQHIFVSGDIVVQDSGTMNSPPLAVDYSQSSIRKIQPHEAGHFTLHYLTASELIALANVWVETADLTIWATYIEAGPEPTVTPLPTPAVEPDTTP